jgi:putative ABC transport system permease protein
MSRLRQIAALLQMSFWGIPQRLGAALVTVIGIACVVGVLVSMLSMGVGARRVAVQNARPDRAIVMSKGAPGFYGSSLTEATVNAIKDTPNIRKDARGRPLASAFTSVFIDAYKKSNHGRTNVLLFGADALEFEVNSEVQIIEGRAFHPGVHELIAGRTRAQLFEGFDIGDNVRVRGSDWTVVGQFVNGGGFEDFLIGDAATLASAIARDTMQGVAVVLESPRQYDDFVAALQSNPAIDVQVKRQAEWEADNIKGLSGLLDFVSYFVGTVMAIGASLGALNVMYSIIDARRRELATLRAIGFGGTAIVVSVIVESLCLALPGALFGALIAWLCFNGNTVMPAGVSIHLSVTLHLITLGIVWALGIGLIGGFLPALRASRIPVATALRAT